jgi:hypothetical protein
MSRDWGRAIRKMHDSHDSNADEEARRLWREFTTKFRNGEFNVDVRGYRYADWDKIDQFMRRGPHH